MTLPARMRDFRGWGILSVLMQRVTRRSGLLAAIMIAPLIAGCSALGLPDDPATLGVTGAAFADLDGDADLDLIVNTTGPGTLIFFNDSQGRFTPATHLPILPPEPLAEALPDVTWIRPANLVAVIAPRPSLRTTAVAVYLPWQPSVKSLIEPASA